MGDQSISLPWFRACCTPTVRLPQQLAFLSPFNKKIFSIIRGRDLGLHSAVTSYLVKHIRILKRKPVKIKLQQEVTDSSEIRGLLL